MRADMVNCTIENLRPVLQRQSVEYERAKFQSILDKTPGEWIALHSSLYITFSTLLYTQKYRKYATVLLRCLLQSLHLRIFFYILCVTFRLKWSKNCHIDLPVHLLITKQTLTAQLKTLKRESKVQWRMSQWLCHLFFTVCVKVKNWNPARLALIWNFLRCFRPHYLLDQVCTGGAAVIHRPYRTDEWSWKRTTSGAWAISSSQRCLHSHPHMGLLQEPTAWGSVL